MSARGTSRTSGDVRLQSAKWAKVDIEPTSPNDRVWPQADLGLRGKRNRCGIKATAIEAVGIKRIEVGRDSYRDCAVGVKGAVGSGAPLGFWAP
jgi:hypothetical protein